MSSNLCWGNERNEWERDAGTQGRAGEGQQTNVRASTASAWDAGGHKINKLGLRSCAVEARWFFPGLLAGGLGDARLSTCDLLCDGLGLLLHLIEPVEKRLLRGDVIGILHRRHCSRNAGMLSSRYSLLSTHSSPPSSPRPSRLPGSETKSASRTTARTFYPLDSPLYPSLSLHSLLLQQSLSTLVFRESGKTAKNGQTKTASVIFFTRLPENLNFKLVATASLERTAAGREGERATEGPAHSTAKGGSEEKP